MIRNANKDDISSITELWEEMMEFHIQKSSLYEIKDDAREIYSNYLKEVQKNSKNIVLVYEINNKIVGYLIACESVQPPVYKETCVGDIIEIAVTEKYRKKGIGEELLEECEKIFLKRGINRVECMVSDFNEISKGFWLKNGYNPYNIMFVKKLG